MFYSVVIVVTVVVDTVGSLIYSILQIIMFQYWIRTSVHKLLLPDTEPHTKRCQNVTEKRVGKKR